MARDMRAIFFFCTLTLFPDCPLATLNIAASNTVVEFRI